MRSTSSACSRARDTVAEAIDAQRYFDFGAQNWMYVDDRGNIGYKTSGEIPLREDLQAGTVAGLPPYFIRNGTGGNEWIADPTPAEDQASPYEILPFAEMDGLVNPKRGWISNANQDPNGQTFDNDPLNELRPGGGIRYITPGHSDGNRNARVTKRLQETLAGGDVSFSEMTSIQADQKLNDAEVLTPYITAALRAAQTPGAPPALAALGADPKVQEAVARLAAWQFSTPTGIPEGFDATDPFGLRLPPTQAEIDASVATTIYSLWRGRALARDRGRPAPGPRPRQLPAGRRSGDDARSGTCSRRAAPGPRGSSSSPGPVGRDTADPPGAQERARPGCEPGLRARLRRLDEPRRLPLGQAAPDHVPASARRAVLDPDRRGLHRPRRRACRASPPTAASAPSTPRRTTRAPRR